jgi:predicted nucleotidyltransferase
LHPDTRYHVREIARLTNTAAGSLHRELSNLAEAQVLLRETSGNQVYYQANINFPIFSELAGILRKTSGLIDILGDALAPLREKIEVAFIFGSMARGTENSGSDIDLMIIGRISFSDAVTALYSTQAIIGREINPKVYNRVEWQKLIKNKNSFLQEILSKPKLLIIGTTDDIEQPNRNKS